MSGCPDAKRIRLFLDDQPRGDLRGDDTFGHTRYASALLRILEGMEPDKSCVIGLFGEWGVGKTSIVNDLARLVEESDGARGRFRKCYTIVKLDAWRYSDANLRRELLLDVAKCFNCEAEIRERISKGLTTEKREYKLPSWRTTLRWAALFLVITAVVALASRLQGSEESRFATMLVGILAAALTTTAAGLGEIFRPITVVEQTSAPIHADQFGEVFRDILNCRRGRASTQRFVVVIDNLDRVPGELVMQVLGAVKSFLNDPQCVYVLPCDEKGLKRHVREFASIPKTGDLLSEADAAEYLRKYFQVSLTIRSLLQEDLEVFIDRTLEQVPFLSNEAAPEALAEGDLPAQDAPAKKENRDAVAHVFRVALARNPRQIIQLANKLVASFLLAVERRIESPDLGDRVLANLGFLAKLVVIEDRWPAFHALLLQRPDTLRYLETYFQTEDERLLPFALAGILSDQANPIVLEWRNGLSDFLRRTSDVRTDRASDFLLLKEPRNAMRIANFVAFHDAALAGDSDSVIDTLSDGVTDGAAAVSHLLQELDHQLSLKNDPTSASIASCLVSVVAAEPPSLDNVALDTLAARAIDTFGKARLAGYVNQVSLPKLLPVLVRMKHLSGIHPVVSHLVNGIDLPARPERSTAVLRALVDHPELLNEGSRKGISDRLPAEDEKLAPAIRELAAHAFTVPGARPCEIFPSKLWEGNIRMLETPGPEADAALTSLRMFVPCLDERLLVMLSDMVVKKLGTQGQAMASVEQGLKILQVIPARLVPDAVKPRIVRGLATSYVPAAEQGQRWRVVGAFFHLMPGLEEDQVQGFAQYLVHFVSKADAQGLRDSLGRTQEQAGRLGDLQNLLEAIETRTSAFVDDPTIRSGFFEVAKNTNRLDLSVALVLATWTKGNVAWGETSLGRTLLQEVGAYLSPKEFRNLAEQLMDQSLKLPQGNKEVALRTLGSFVDHYTLDFLRVLVDRLLSTWLTSPQAEDRRAGVALWRGIRSKAVKESDRFHERILEFIKQAVNLNSVTQEAETVLVEYMIDDQTGLESGQRDAFVNVAMRFVEDGRPEAVRVYGHQVLRRLSGWPEAQDPVPGKVIDLLENQHDDLNTKNNLYTIQAYRPKLRTGVRKRLEEFLRSNEEQAPVRDFLRETNSL